MQLHEVIIKYIDRALMSVRLPFRGKLTRLTTKAPIQLVQGEGLAQEQLQAVELIQQFGFTSGVPTGAQLVVIPLGGKTVNSVVVATEHSTFRIQVEDGETALYNQWGAKILLKKEKQIEISCEQLILNASKELIIKTPKLTITPEEEGTTEVHLEGNFTNSGTITSEGDQIASGVSQENHKHGGVETGSGQTSAPVK